MHPPFLQSYSHLESPLHHLPTGLKLATALALVLTTVLFPAPHAPWLTLIAAFLLLLTWLSRIPPTFLLQRLLLLEPLAVGVALLALLQPHGWQVFLLIVARSTLCLAIMILLSNTAPFGNILHVLRRVGVPSILLTIMALMYRYLFVLVDESIRMRRARASRTFVPRRGVLWRTFATVIGQLFVRSVDRAERLYIAMCARGWK